MAERLVINKYTIVLVVLTAIISFVAGMIYGRHIWKGDGAGAAYRFGITQAIGIGLFVWYTAFEESPDTMVSLLLISISLGGLSGEWVATIAEKYVGKK